MKKYLLILFIGFVALPSVAQTGASALSDASDGIFSYTPYVQGLCFAIAAIIAIVGALSTYMAMQTAPQQITKRISITLGSCLCFVSMALALPHFFGYESYSTGENTSSSISGTSSSSDGFLASDKGGISQSGIITEIPSFADDHWVHFPSGTKMETANYLLDIYAKNGNGSPGSYGNTLDYIQKLYWNREIDYGTFNALISLSGNLPHN
jgi:hypothetical protein